MDDVIAKLEDLAPVAEAIVYLTRQGARVKELSSLLSKQETDLQTGEERLAEIEKLCAEAKVGAEQARAAVIEAQGKIEQMIEGARAEAKLMINGAKTEADKIAQRERTKFGAEEARLRQGIQALNKENETLDAAIQAKRNDHDAVQASIDSLKKRLG